MIRQAEAREPNAIQLERLASLTGLPVAELANKTVASLKDELLVNPGLLDFEIVCGQVVKVDPNTGVKYPVAGATVNVYDVVCDWLWFFPLYWPWSWAFRFRPCNSELVDSVVTDSCGNFCVVVPRWDIEWVQSWIRERWCFPEILARPTVSDVLLPLLASASQPAPGSLPDPAALAGVLAAREDLAATVGPRVVEAIRGAGSAPSVGASNTGLSAALASSAFSRPIPAPVPAELRALAPAAAHEALAARLGLPVEAGELDLSDSFGPFGRCLGVDLPLWFPFFSVPDISFEVTQDIGGNGTQEVIYGGAFDTVWGALPASPVELDASQSAIASPFPGCRPVPVPCEGAPAITQIGYLDVNPDYLDPDSGFAIRMNQPDAAPYVPSSAPFAGYLPLFGCAPEVPYYRVVASYANSDGLTTPQNSDGSLAPLPASDFGPPLPVMAPNPWQVSQTVGGVTELSPPIAPDANGWYSTEYLSWEPENLLVNWAPPADGVYQLSVEVGTGTPGNVTLVGSSSPAIPLVVDSSDPTVVFSATGWSYEESPSSWTPITSNDGCLLISRTNQDIYVQLTYNVSAKYLYSVALVSDGCDMEGVTLVSADPECARYTYDGPFDNSLSGVATYKISAGAAQGCYSWTLTAYSRAFSPNDPRGLTDVAGFAWNTVLVPIYVDPSISIAIVAAS